MQEQERKLCAGEGEVLSGLLNSLPPRVALQPGPWGYSASPGLRQDSTRVPPAEQARLPFPKLYFIKCIE